MKDPQNVKNIDCDKIDQFFEKDNVSNLRQEEIDNLSVSVSIKLMGSAINNLPNQVYWQLLSNI